MILPELLMMVIISPPEDILGAVEVPQHLEAWVCRVVKWRGPTGLGRLGWAPGLGMEMATSEFRISR